MLCNVLYLQKCERRGVCKSKKTAADTPSKLCNSSLLQQNSLGRTVYFIKVSNIPFFLCMLLFKIYFFPD